MNTENKRKTPKRISIVLIFLVLVGISIVPIYGTIASVIGFSLLRLFKKTSTKIAIIGIVLSVIVSVLAFVSFAALSYTTVSNTHVYARNLDTNVIYDLGTSRGFNISSFAVLPDSLSLSCSGGGSENITDIHLSPTYFQTSNISPALPFTLGCDNVSTTFNFDIIASNSTPLNVPVLNITYNYDFLPRLKSRVST